ncbi:MAG: LysR family transcriptional regulator [Oscillospiraceae bacterium]|nr:LysR family transcriptional regulator [Oscillospiraceae bacterium]
MELRVLRYFLTAAREENITKAAEVLHLTQPTLSRQLMQLEEELGVKLFVRGKHSITLTDEGMLLRERANEIITLTDKITRDFANKGETLSGTVTIGSGETQSMHLLSQMMTAFRKKYPNVNFEIYSAISDDIKDRIEKGIVDIGLLTEPVDIGRYEFIHMPYKDRWSALIRKDSPLAQKEYVTPEDLSKVPMIVAKRERVRKEIESWFGDYCENTEIAAIYNLLYNASIMVSEGVGVALCFEHDSRYENLCVKPLMPPMQTGTVLVWKKHSITSPVVTAFIEFCKQYIKKINYNILEEDSQ